MRGGGAEGVAAPDQLPVTGCAENASARLPFVHGASHFTERHVAAIFRVEAMEVTRCPGGRLRSPAGGDVYGDALTVPDMVGTLLRCQPYCGGHQPVC